MRALLVAPRVPGTGFTGDRVRGALHLDALARAGFSVTLVGGVRGSAAPAPDVERYLPVRLPAARAAVALVSALGRGDPLQCAFFAGPWRRALAEAGGGWDVVSVLLVRAWPFLRGALPPAPLVLDYVDALSLAASVAAARETSPALRSYWRREGPLLARLEVEAGRCATLRLATTDGDAAALPAGTRSLPNGVRLGEEPSPAGERRRVVAFSGRLGYRPNALAVRRLLSEIWPRVRSQVPDALLAIGGADAPAWLRRRNGSDGVSVESPVGEMSAFLRRARVAVLPLDLGTGSPNKLFEAFEAGTPAVATPELLERAIGRPCEAAAPAASDEEFAARVAAVLQDDAAASRAGAAARAFARKECSREVVVGRLASWYREVAEVAS